MSVNGSLYTSTVSALASTVQGVEGSASAKRKRNVEEHSLLPHSVLPVRIMW